MVVFKVWAKKSTISFTKDNDIYHGYGRYIYSNGNFYIGNWVDGKRSGWGKLVDKSGKTYEGMW